MDEAIRRLEAEIPKKGKTKKVKKGFQMLLKKDKLMDKKIEKCSAKKSK